MSTDTTELRRGVREFVDELRADRAKPTEWEQTIYGQHLARCKALAWVESTARGALRLGPGADTITDERDQYREALLEILAVVTAATGRERAE